MTIKNMLCKECNKTIDDDSNFCFYCGASNEPKKPTKKYLVRWIIGIFIVTSASLLYIISSENLKDYKNDVDNIVEDDYEVYVEEDYSTSLLDEFEYVEPVGYFNNSDVFDSESISDEEWFSYIEYYENENTVPVFDESRFQFPNQTDVFSSVVKIVCEDDDYVYTGSGTNFYNNGYVLTNLHVIDGMVGDCMVGFSDVSTGLIKEIYWAAPIIDKDNVTDHDLAYLSIEEPVFDEEYNIYGYYNKIHDSLLPYFEQPEDCYDTPIQLGERIFIIGYPPLSGGALTITDGLVSSLYSESGYIITSAKIVSGNSGGLAVDERGCYIGVPTNVYYEEGDEYFGEVIDAEFVDEFDKAVEDDIDEYLEE